MTSAAFLAIVSYAAVGLAAGLAYFAALRINVRLYLDGRPRWRPLILHGVRLAAAVALFWALATQGAMPVLAGLGGFVAARFVSRRWKEEPL